MEMVIQYLFIGLGVSWGINFVKSDAGAGEELDNWVKVLIIILWPISILGFLAGIVKGWLD
jgi:hypothetical protein